MTSELRVRPGSGAEVGIGRDDAERLVRELWQVSGTPGAVVAIGKLQHRLRERAGNVVELADEELSAIAAALAEAPALSVRLLELRRAALQAA